MTLPNIITIFRIVLIPVFLIVFYSSSESRILYAGLIFILAGISDVLDGFIARKFDLTSKLGAVLDPFADKLMSFTVLVCFTSIGLIPFWILIPMLIKEGVMIAGAATLYLKHKKAVIPANKFGKIATFSLYAAVVSIIFKLPTMLSIVLLSITLGLNLVAFINYLTIFRKLLADEKLDIDK